MAVSQNELGDAFCDAVEALPDGDKLDFRKCMRVGFNAVWAVISAKADVTVEGVATGTATITDGTIE